VNSTGKRADKVSQAAKFCAAAGRASCVSMLAPARVRAAQRLEFGITSPEAAACSLHGA